MSQTDLVDELAAAQEWMRKPDWAENFSAVALARWLNDRPTRLFPKAAAELTALRTELAALKDEDILARHLVVEAADAGAAELASLRAELEQVKAERDALAEDRARFPDRPDGIGQMIQAHIGNLKAGKKSSDEFANQWWSRMTAAEAELLQATDRIAELEHLRREAVEAMKPFADIPMPPSNGFTLYTRENLFAARAFVEKHQ